MLVRQWLRLALLLPSPSLRAVAWALPGRDGKRNVLGGLEPPIRPGIRAVQAPGLLRAIHWPRR